MRLKVKAGPGIVAFFLIGLMVANASPEAWAQKTPRTAGQEAFTRGWQAFQKEDYGQATERFEEAVREAPTNRFQYGAAAYWLGRAYGAAGQPEQQQRALEEGLTAWREAGDFDFQLADAYLRALPAEAVAENPQAAQRAYRRLLHFIDTRELSADDKRALAPHLAQSAPLWPPNVRRGVLVGGWEARPDEPAQWRFQEGAGQMLRAWWRRQDPFPIEQGNERLAEHLRRVAHARERYTFDESLEGYDARGRIFVQYGPPARHIELELEEPGAHFMGGGSEIARLQELRRDVQGLAVNGVPKRNEVWFYSHIDEAGYYLFIRDGSHYELGGVADLVPQQLRGMSSFRSARTRYSFQVLRSLYMQLSLQHADFMSGYSSVNNYAAQTQSLQPFLRQQYSYAHMTHRLAQRRRRENMPQQYTSQGAYDEKLPLEVRTARFLDEDGQTRTEVYWRPRPGALQVGGARRSRLAESGAPVGDDALVRLALVRQSEDYITRGRQAKSYLVRGAMQEEAADATAFPVQTATTRTDEARFHLALRWSQYGMTPSADGPARPGARVRRTIQRIDSLDALKTRQLQMSDLRPVSLSEQRLIGMERPREQTRQHVYLSDTLAAGTPLALYFEVYNLAYNADDQTRYTVEYEVQRRMERGGLAGLFRGDREERTSTEATYTSRIGRTEEFITLNLNEEEDDGVIRVVVRITDETTGQQVERTIRFFLES